MHFRVLLAATAIILSLSQSESRGDWKTVNATDDSFEVSFPGKPEASTRPAGKESNDATINVLTREEDGGKVAYVVAWRALSASERKMADTDKLLQRVEDGNRARFGKQTELIESVAVKVQKQTGRQYSFTGAIGQKSVLVHSRLIKTDDRIYQLHVVQLDTTAASLADVVRFVGSFKLSK